MGTHQALISEKKKGINSVDVSHVDHYVPTIGSLPNLNIVRSEEKNVNPFVQASQQFSPQNIGNFITPIKKTDKINPFVQSTQQFAHQNIGNFITPIKKTDKTNPFVQAMYVSQNTHQTTGSIAIHEDKSVRVNTESAPVNLTGTSTQHGGVETHMPTGIRHGQIPFAPPTVNQASINITNSANEKHKVRLPVDHSLPSQFVEASSQLPSVHHGVALQHRRK